MRLLDFIGLTVFFYIFYFGDKGSAFWKAVICEKGKHSELRRPSPLGLWKFALSFGVAATFKYHALLFFLVLLVLREKKIRNLIKYAVVMAVPLMIEVLPNIGNIYFKRNVLGFGVLKFVQKPFTIGFFDGINLVAVTAAFMLV